MSYQNREIHRANNSLSCKSRGAVVVMIGEIRNQKQRGRDYSRNLAISMSLDSTKTNKSKTREQQKGAGGIQDRVQMGEEWDVFRHLSTVMSEA